MPRANAIISKQEVIMNQNIRDRDIIAALGGPAQMAKLLGYDLPGGQWRVNNWVQRGIPSRVKLDRPDLLKKARRILRRFE